MGGLSSLWGICPKGSALHLCCIAYYTTSNAVYNSKKSKLNQFIKFFVIKFQIIYVFHNWLFQTKIFVENLLSSHCSKIGKKCNFKSTKTHFLLFQKWQKINFCTRKKFKTTKNAIFGLFSGAKIYFLPFLKRQIMCFCTI